MAQRNQLYLINLVNSYIRQNQICSHNFPFEDKMRTPTLMVKRLRNRSPFAVQNHSCSVLLRRLRGEWGRERKRRNRVHISAKSGYLLAKRVPKEALCPHQQKTLP
ncbi:hypothetical protein GOBAR_AA22606 [Gossypium barbadense]|uniref:Uncharacterized protein n=1 Tax=Gossypium barbadense TaxID=3634 RepID=A0A2P5X3Z2_GOSBA|nr:hypothetical protein GOBAR_AA22606 [Gossypium barbadense]